MNIKSRYSTLLKSYDGLGIISSVLCAIHCLLAPVLFTAVTCSKACCSSAPSWYAAFDFLFIILSGIAIFFAVNHTKIKWIKIGFLISFSLLILTALNQRIKLVELHSNSIYAIFATLITLHIINFYRCCNSKNDHYPRCIE